MTASIMVHSKTNTLGMQEAKNYEWIGASPFLEVFPVLLGDLGYTNFNEPAIRLGPYKLLFVEYRPHKGVILYVRADRLGKIRVALYKATRLLDLIYRRLIITMAVWNLADYHISVIPTWTDIKIVQKWRKYESKND